MSRYIRLVRSHMKPRVHQVLNLSVFSHGNGLYGGVGQGYSIRLSIAAFYYFLIFAQAIEFTLLCFLNV